MSSVSGYTSIPGSANYKTLKDTEAQNIVVQGQLIPKPAEEFYGALNVAFSLRLTAEASTTFLRLVGLASEGGLGVVEARS